MFPTWWVVIAFAKGSSENLLGVLFPVIFPPRGGYGPASRRRKEPAEGDAMDAMDAGVRLRGVPRGTKRDQEG